MVATTYSGAGIAVPADTVKKSKGLWARVFNAIAESQAKRAEREIAETCRQVLSSFDVAEIAQCGQR